MLQSSGCLVEKVHIRCWWIVGLTLVEYNLVIKVFRILAFIYILGGKGFGVITQHDPLDAISSCVRCGMDVACHGTRS